MDTVDATDIQPSLSWSGKPKPEPKHISFGVTVERHSKGTNFSLRIDGAETEDELMSRAVALWEKLEWRFGAKEG